MEETRDGVRLVGEAVVLRPNSEAHQPFDSNLSEKLPA